MTKLNLFYEEPPEVDRWFIYDKYPRRLARRIIRGRPRPGGVMMIALQLMRGLDKLGIAYRFNDYKYAKNNSDELVGVIGKPHLIFERRLKNPILFGAGVYSHPIDCADLFSTYPNVKKILVPGDWMQSMFEPYYKEKVLAWPVGIDTERWKIDAKDSGFDFLVYTKFLWDKQEKKNAVLEPITDELTKRGLSFRIIEYGHYEPATLLKSLSKTRAAIFLCEHETQGMAYQQILSTNTPLLAWEQGGYWLDPSYYPEKVKYQPVTSVPYWDHRCGEKFEGLADFSSKLTSFIERLDSFSPRQFIVENLSLEKAALEYVKIYNEVQSHLKPENQGMS